MGTAKTDQDIRDEDVAHSINCRRPMTPFQFRVDPDMRGTFTVSLKFLKLGEVQAVLDFLEDHHREWYETIQRR
jgi:hypothetical protein